VVWDGSDALAPLCCLTKPPFYGSLARQPVVLAPSAVRRLWRAGDGNAADRAAADSQHIRGALHRKIEKSGRTLVGLDGRGGRGGLPGRRPGPPP
jgi:hypothetical protein